MDRIELLKNSLREKTCVKVIAGIDNFDIEKVRQIVTGAQQGGASAVDVAARKDIITIAKELTDLPVFVSSIDPEELAMAANNGADVLEVGNFDALYKNGLRITAQEVIDITKRTIELVGNNIMISVTVPGHIDISEQIALAQELENLGVDLIQTEGAAITEPKSAGARGLIEKAQVSIANTIELVRNVEIPVMTASGITTTTAPLAIAAGASAVGVGSCINKLNSTLAMIAEVRSIVESIEKIKTLTEEKTSI
ncbi:MAG: DUF561 domain-containing protein [Candidatus Gastranaerophilales bacterium]|nr:DUF561 domain-containing protein [Candidatus Gastranaerophilales bacterium]